MASRPAGPGATPFLSQRMLKRLVSALLLTALLIAARAGAAQDLPPSLADRFSTGVDALKAGNLDAAEAAFRDVLKGGGERAFVHHNLGIVLQQRGRTAEALAEFREASRLDPSFGPARLLAGTALLALGRPKEAVTELRQAARLMPNETAPRLQLANAYERSGDIRGVVGEYRRLVVANPSNDEYIYRLGKAYLRQAQWSFERMRSVDPHTARLPQALARQYLDQGRPDLAAAAFEQAATLAPTLPDIHLALARIHLDEGRFDDAAREIERELAIAPDSAEARAVGAQIDAARKK
jgi:tetratricopeptide (TPR) repeat protein